MNIQEILDRVKQHQDINYKKFSEKIIREKKLIGVRTPVLESISAYIIKDDPLSYLDHYKKNCYEMDLIYGFVMAKSDLSIEQRILYCDNFISLIDNWCVCDQTVARCKWMRKENNQIILDYLQKHLNTKNVWHQRFVYVSLLDHFLNEKNLHQIFCFCDYPFQYEYYVQMAVAWLLSMAIVKYPEQTKTYLQNSTLDTFTYNKTLQKACESKQISKEEKMILRKMKRK